MHSLVASNHHPNHPLVRVFCNFVMFCLCMKKNDKFLHFSVLCLFSGLASVNSVQPTVVQFSTSCSSSLIRQKVESQNGGNKKAKHAKFSEKQTFLTS